MRTNTKVVSTLVSGVVLASSAIAWSLPDTLIFFAQDARQTTSTGDWAANQWKSECSGSWLTGVSEFPSGTSAHSAHAALCDARPSTSNPATPGTFLGALDFAQGNNQPSPWKSGDWDPGFYKAECSRSAGAAIVGVAQNQSGQITKIACRAGAPAAPPVPNNEPCEVHTFYSRTSSGSMNTGINAPDWDFGYFKGECQKADSGSNGFFARGLSRDPVSGAPHAILCCH
jgi:hypothetical protein